MIKKLSNIFYKSAYRWKKANLHVQIEAGNLEKVRDILNKDPSLANAIYHKTYTPLHVAVHEEQKEIVAELISKGANVHAETPKGITPLDVAEDIENHSIAFLLKQY